MPAPTSYTEKQLAEFMHKQLGKTAAALGLHPGSSDAGDYVEVVNDTLLACSVETIASITGMTNIQKLRALAMVCAWQYVVNNFAALYDFSADGGRYDRGQLFEQAKKALTLAQQQALPYDANYQIGVIAVDQIHDPYAVRPEDETGV